MEKPGTPLSTLSVQACSQVYSHDSITVVREFNLVEFYLVASRTVRQIGVFQMLTHDEDANMSGSKLPVQPWPFRCFDFSTVNIIARILTILWSR